MARIALISDTHGYICPRILELVAECDEVWHAGDIGSAAVVEAIEKVKPLRAVWGNIDGTDMRQRFPEFNRFSIDGLDVLITHIGGYPGKYDSKVMPIIRQNPPKLLVCGHSHILKVMNDKSLGLLYMNPGAAGKYGFHLKRTMLMFEVEDATCKNLSVHEWDK